MPMHYILTVLTDCVYGSDKKPAITIHQYLPKEVCNGRAHFAEPMTLDSSVSVFRKFKFIVSLDKCV